MLLRGPTKTQADVIVVGATYQFQCKFRSKATGLTLLLIGVEVAARLDIRAADRPNAELIQSLALNSGISYGVDALGEEYLQIRMEPAQTRAFQGKGINRRAVGYLELQDALGNVAHPLRFAYTLDYGDPVG